MRISDCNQFNYLFSCARPQIYAKQISAESNFGMGNLPLADFNCSGAAQWNKSSTREFTTQSKLMTRSFAPCRLPYPKFTSPTHAANAFAEGKLSAAAMLVSFQQ
jgi:hypothetical protein